ncbi:RES family NAD+ phosphorylase [Aquincola tertiaricarbonis]|uniref:RES family NAD+ phosphorylase n=1 Tax=Aquincola tertiaricarbonis TaxID=391953 RepID=A0ABY4SHJ9_AQUTE|nr:RES family NAD+ phosphorylase [Aquincola tertiaricarbonis]URI10805.1 RES family NAD+ phosphorylase [Aquincola tertiaricarbonis]
MKLADLEYLAPHLLAQGQSLFRTQRTALVGESVARGPLHLAPIGSLSGRFDLARVPCAYLAEAPDTALLEAVFRRESTGVSIAGLQFRELLAVQTRSEFVLGDLRPHASAWPVLQSLRFSETQALAAEAKQAGFSGLIYRSAQHFAQDCVVLFDPPAGAMKALWRTPLANRQGAVSKWVAEVARRSLVPLVP